MAAQVAAGGAVGKRNGHGRLSGGEPGPSEENHAAGATSAMTRAGRAKVRRPAHEVRLACERPDPPIRGVPARPLTRGDRPASGNGSRKAAGRAADCAAPSAVSSPLVDCRRPFPASGYKGDQETASSDLPHLALSAVPGDCPPRSRIRASRAAIAGKEGLRVDPRLPVLVLSVGKRKSSNRYGSE